MSKYVLDTSALIALIENEEGSSTVESLLLNAIDGEDELFISIVSNIELYYISLQEQGKDVADKRLSLLDNLYLRQESVTTHLVRIVGKIKAYNRLSFADSCIVGLAILKDAVLVHKDPEFEQVREDVKQLKLPYK